MFSIRCSSNVMSSNLYNRVLLDTLSEIRKSIYSEVLVLHFILISSALYNSLILVSFKSVQRCKIDIFSYLIKYCYFHNSSLINNRMDLLYTTKFLFKFKSKFPNPLLRFLRHHCLTKIDISNLVGKDTQSTVRIVIIMNNYPTMIFNFIYTILQKSS